jgi:methylenetetrahydrofolate dehydrogenase (NADP+)/methenyltetrahydrofolate cyclohydrolase
LPVGLEQSRGEIIESVDPKKDVDGLTSTNQHFLAENNSAAIIPATARGVKELLEYYHIELRGKKVAVVGRSQLVGAPIAHVCRYAGADVIVCHSKTADLAHETSKADIVIVAVGKVGLIGRKYVKSGAIVIDVGINRVGEDASVIGGNVEAVVLKGDVDYGAVKDVVAAITPVPGGVGQMTVLALFENLLDVCQ